MRYIVAILAALLLTSCGERKLSEAELKQQLEQVQQQKQAEAANLKDLTYKVVCLNGYKYYASRVMTYDGHFGLERELWVIGGAVIHMTGSDTYVERCEVK